MYQTPVDFTQIKKVLVAKLRHHGDVLLASPVFSLLKKRFPHLEIEAYLYKETYPMLEGHPAISNYVLYDKGWKKLSFFGRLIKELALLKKIRKTGYDLVINLTEGDRGAIAAKISKCKYAVGFDPENKGLFGKKKWYTHIIKHTPHPRHTVEKQLDALRCLGVFPDLNEKNLFFHIPISARKTIQKRLLEAQIKIGEYIHIHPVSRWMFKTLPTQTVVDVIRFLHGKGKKIVLTGSKDPSEIEMNKEICLKAKDIPILNLSGAINLKELGAVIAKSACLLSVDSVPLHLASSLKVPVIAIFGPSCEKNWGPYHHPISQTLFQSFPCRPCYQPGCGGSGKSECLTTLPAEVIIHSVSALLQKIEQPLKSFIKEDSIV